MTGLRVDDDEDDLPEALFSSTLVVELLRLFGKAVRAHQLYLPNNPMHSRAIEAARVSFRSLWQETESIALQVSEAGFHWEGRPVLDEPGEPRIVFPGYFSRTAFASSYSTATSRIQKCWAC